MDNITFGAIVIVVAGIRIDLKDLSSILDNSIMVDRLLSTLRTAPIMARLIQLHHTTTEVDGMDLKDLKGMSFFELSCLAY